MTPYAREILAIAPTANARYVEAYMRCEHGTLDALSASQFSHEVSMACLCIDEGGNIAAERLAQSYGL